MTQFTLVSEHKSLFGLTGGSLGVGLKPVPLIEYVCIVSNCPLPPVIREHGSSEWFEVISQCYVWRVSHSDGGERAEMDQPEGQVKLCAIPSCRREPVFQSS